jgi:hypothetical protein
MSVTIKSLVKSKTKDGVSILKPWKTNSELLSRFMNVQHSSKTKRSPTMRLLDKFNLLYVVQSQADRSNNIFKIGVSKGVGRLNEYVKMHGDPDSKTHPQTSRCTGVYLVYLAGKLRADASSRKSTAGKLDAEIVDYYRHSKWSIRKERQIFAVLKRNGVLPARGNEWFQVNDNGDKLKRIVTQSAGAATKEAQDNLKEELENGRLIKADNSVVSVGKPLLGGLPANKGVYYYKLEWNTSQLEALTPKQIKAGKKARLTPYTYESLKTSYSEQNKRNKVSEGLGDNIVKLIHTYIMKHDLTMKDKSYDVKRKTRSNTV